MAWLRKQLLALGLICVGVGIAGSLIVYSAADGFPSGDEPSAIEKTAAARDVSRIVLHSDFPDVTIVKSPDDDIHVRLAGPMTERQKGAKLDVQVKDGTMSAGVDLGGRGKKMFNFDLFELVRLINGSYEKLRLEVALPDQRFDSIELTTDAGDIVAERPVQADRVRLQTAFGDITMDAFQGKRLELQTDAGDIEAVRIESSELVEATTSFGDIELAFDQVADSVDVTTAAGDIGIRLPKLDALRVDLKNDVGNIDVDLPKLQTRNKSSRSVDGTVGTGGPLLKARSDFGDIEVMGK